VKAITDLANRLEGKALQAMAVDVGAGEDLAAALERARKRVIQGMTPEEINEKIRQLEEQLCITNAPRAQSGQWKNLGQHIVPLVRYLPEAGAILLHCNDARILSLSCQVYCLHH
jgi:hypothetical protein